MADLSKILDGFRPSPISEIYSLTTRLKEAGRDIVDLSIGEPDFETPPGARAAGIAAIEAGDTKYTSTDGTAALREAVRAKFARDNGLDFEIQDILVDSGVKPLLFHAMQAVLDPGDEVLLPVPCWASYTGMAALLGARAVLLPCPEAQGFKLDPESLAKAITPRSKLLLLNSPGNPTGAVYDAAALGALAEVLLDHPGVWVFSDDIYEHIVFDGRRFATMAQAAPALAERTLTFNGVSKGYAMTGWRIGYVGGPPEAIGAIRQILSQTSGNPPTMSQAAAVAALEGPQEFLAERAEGFRARRDLLVAGLNAVPGLSCRPPEGAFYLYVNCGALIGARRPDGGAIASSADLVKYFLEEAGVALVPGSAFNHDPYFRASCATSTAALQAAVERLGAACGKLERERVGAGA